MFFCPKAAVNSLLAALALVHGASGRWKMHPGAFRRKTWRSPGERCGSTHWAGEHALGRLGQRADDVPGQ